MTTSATPSPPAAVDGVAGTTRVDGVDVAWERWGATGAPLLVLVHGTSAHTAWWHHTLPWLADVFDVVAVDLSGHGESGWRPEGYSLEQWSGEVLAVAADTVGGADGAVLVGHSIGGLVTAGAAARDPGAVRALVLVDCLVTEPERAERVRPVLRQDVCFGSAAEGLARYRLMPPQPVPDDRTLVYVAERSLREDVDGWRWKVDPAIFGALDTDPLTRALRGVRCPTAVVRGELSALVAADAGRRLSRLIGAPVAQYDVPDAHHHVMIDQGPAFGRLLRRALDDLGEVLAPATRPVTVDEESP